MYLTGVAEFSVRFIQALTIRMSEFEAFLKILKIRSIKKITHRHLVDFVADYENPSIHVRKSRVWKAKQYILLQGISISIAFSSSSASFSSSVQLRCVAS